MSLVTVKEDERGKHMEIFKIPGVGQVNYAISNPGAIRGNHYHKRKKEKFCVVEGEAKISLRNRANNKVEEFYVSGLKPEVIDIPTDSIHNIENIGKNELKILIWVNEIFDPDDPDVFKEEI